MTINRDFNLSASVATARKAGDAVDSTTLTDTYDVSAVISTGPVAGSTDGMGAVLGADATAIGEDTFASVTAEASLNAGPIATSARVILETDAVAASADQPYASATGSIELVGGAQWAFSLSYDSSVVDQEIGGTIATSSSIDYLYALNVDTSEIAVPSAAVELPEVMVPDDPEAEPMLGSPAFDDPCGCDGDWSIPLDGNVAMYDIAMDALADDAFIEVDLFTIAVEDQMSSVALGAFIVIA